MTRLFRQPDPNAYRALANLGIATAWLPAAVTRVQPGQERVDLTLEAVQIGRVFMMQGDDPAALLAHRKKQGR